jgi:UDPglucose--hexose-1-phosphate uridylyltransferase
VRANGEQNPSYTSTFVFPNDFSAVKETQPEYRPSHEEGSHASHLLRAEPVTGKCHVVCFNPAHNVTLADMSPIEILPILSKWTELYAAHLSPTSPLKRHGHTHSPIANSDAQPAQQFKYMQIFENKGPAMGCSNPHPHGQIWATTHIPEEPLLELQHLLQYSRSRSSHLLVDYAALESQSGERTVHSNASFLAVVPWWATWPFEVLILPRAHKRALVDFDEGESLDLAASIAHVCRAYDNLFETSFPYSMGIHQAPLECGEEEAEASAFHVHFYPPLLRSRTVRKYMVGYEMMAEPQRDITPEQAAERLRGCGGVLYRGSPARIPE